MSGGEIVASAKPVVTWTEGTENGKRIRRQVVRVPLREVYEELNGEIGRVEGVEILSSLRPIGDGPCTDCGDPHNIVWFTDSVFWNAVCRRDEDAIEPTLCVPCFVLRVHRAGYAPTGWRLTPEWPWRRTDG